MTKPLKVIPMSELRIKLPKLRRQVQLGNLRIVCTHYGELAAFLLPLKDIESITLEEGVPAIQTTEELPLTEFRTQLTEACERLYADVDCIYLTFHRRRVVAVISPRFRQHLPLPLVGDADQVWQLPSHASEIQV